MAQQQQPPCYDRDHMNSEVLVLNQDYEPLNVASLPRAFRLVLGGKAEILAEGDPIRSASRSWTAPSVVRLRHRVRRPRPRAKLSRKEIFARDGHACQYCGRTGVSLTIDHIVPKSRGGDTWTWENLVTACMSCNHRKGDRLPEAAGLQLRRKPYEPRCDVYAVFLPYLRHDAYSACRDFLFISDNVAASGA